MRAAPSIATTAVLIALLGAACTREPVATPPASGPETTTREFRSGDFAVDRIYRSMQGPVDQQWITLDDQAPGETVWVTGVDVEAVDPNGGTPIADGQQFVCHVNVSHPSPEEWEVAFKERQKRGQSVPFNFFTLIQGHYSLEFPDGFGLPISTDQRMRVMSMAMNQRPETKPFDMQIRTRVHYLRDADLIEPLIPLNKFSFDVRVPSPDPFGEHAHLGAAGEGCAELDTPQELHDAQQTSRARADAAAPEFEKRLHFSIPPGRHEYRSSLAGNRKIPFDTTAHHISAHLHVFGESLELIDKTTGESLFKSVATSNSGRTGVVDMTHWSSAEGIPMYRDHTYEVVATYDNTTDDVIDGMGVVYIYYRDEPPEAARTTASRASSAG